MNRLQQGLTVIELLVALSVISIVITLVWGIFSQGNDYSKKSVARNQMEQEANMIISNLSKIHNTSQKYVIESSEGVISVSFENEESKNNSTVFESSQFNYSVKLPNHEFSAEVDPMQEDLKLEITIFDKDHHQNSFTLETILHRLKER